VGATSNSEGPCAQQKRVAPGRAADSLLYHKISGGSVCGDPMPIGDQPLSGAEVERIATWIDAGAAMCSVNSLECGGSCCNTSCVQGHCLPDNPADDPTPTFGAVYAQVIKLRCGPCHIANAQGGLAMPDEDTAYQNLVGVDTKVDGPCKSKTRVKAGDTAASVFFSKVSGENLCGGKMPFGAPALTTKQVDLIKSWIKGGAPR
jgi:hypothetical protein